MINQWIDYVSCNDHTTFWERCVGPYFQFYIHPRHISTTLHEISTYWIIKPNIGNMNMKKYLGDEDEYTEQVEDFQEGIMEF